MSDPVRLTNGQRGFIDHYLLENPDVSSVEYINYADPRQESGEGIIRVKFSDGFIATIDPNGNTATDETNYSTASESYDADPENYVSDSPVEENGSEQRATIVALTSQFISTLSEPVGVITGLALVTAIDRYVSDGVRPGGHSEQGEAPSTPQEGTSGPETAPQPSRAPTEGSGV